MEKLTSKLKSMFRLSGTRLTFKQKLTLALPGPASVIGPIIIHNTLMKF